MSRMARRTVLLTGAVVLVLAVQYGPALAFHLLPHNRSGEAGRLASVLEVVPGSAVADIGAGSGWLAAEMANRVGASGRVYATEVAPDKLRGLTELATSRQLANLEVREGGERDPALPAACCDAIYMRNVLHHIEDWPPYVAALATALKEDGRIAILDFVPGAFFHLGGDHGAEPGRVVSAFASAGFVPARRDDKWGGRMYLLVFRRAPEPTH